MTKTKSQFVHIVLCVLLTSAGVVATDAASAADPGAGMKANTQMQGETGSPAGGAARMGGSAEPRLGTEGGLNQNAQGLPDATRGLERAQERMSPKGMEHEQATEQESTMKTKREKKPARKE